MYRRKCQRISRVIFSPVILPIILKSFEIYQSLVLLCSLETKKNKTVDDTFQTKLTESQQNNYTHEKENHDTKKNTHTHIYTQTHTDIEIHIFFFSLSIWLPVSPLPSNSSSFPHFLHPSFPPSSPVLDCIRHPHNNTVITNLFSSLQPRQYPSQIIRLFKPFLVSLTAPLL